MPNFSVTNDAGHTFNVRIVRPGDKYGLNRMLTYRVDDLIKGNPNTYHGPMIEFYDAEYTGGSFDPEGQFVTRYFADNLLNHKPGVGLMMQGGIPKWVLSGQNMDDVRDWIIKQLSHQVTLSFNNLDLPILEEQIARMQHLALFAPGNNHDINLTRGVLKLLETILAGLVGQNVPFGESANRV